MPDIFDYALSSIYGVGLQRAGDDWEASCKIQTAVKLSIPNGITFLVVACLAAAGSYSGIGLGFYTLGFAACGYLIKLSFGNLSERKFYVLGITLVAAAFIPIGALGGAGILSGAQVGWGMIGISLTGVVVKGIFLAIDIQNRLPAHRSLRNLINETWTAL